MLRGQVEEARTVAMGLACLSRYLRGQHAVDLVCERRGGGSAAGVAGAVLAPAGPAGAAARELAAPCRYGAVTTARTLLTLPPVALAMAVHSQSLRSFAPK